MDKANSSDDPIGVGRGVTGASGDFIEGTGEDQGIGGTGERSEHDAAGKRPDERQNPAPQELENAAPPPDRANTIRPSGSQSGTIGGGGPDAVVRNVTPENDRDTGGRVHESGDSQLGGGSDREGR